MLLLDSLADYNLLNSQILSGALLAILQSTVKLQPCLNMCFLC